MCYEIGKYYTFRFQEMYVGRDGNNYIRLADPQNPEGRRISVKPYDFQNDWEYDNIPDTLTCYCRQQDIYGNYRFEQSREEIYNNLYLPYIGHYRTFSIIRHLEQENNGNCCLISDTFGITQRYYPRENNFWENFNVGDDITLFVQGIHPSDANKNNAYLELLSHEQVAAAEITIEERPREPETYIRNEEVISLGSEDDHTEFKSSIAFPAGGTEEDMAKQLSVIMKNLAGFMNKDGGTLYIGINDAGEPVTDISSEFQYLNDDEQDSYYYQPSEDHYKLKLINKITRDLGSYASTLVNITFPEASGIKYAAITVKKSDAVIWYNGTGLFVRCDNCIRHMKGDSITHYILQRTQNMAGNNIFVNYPAGFENDTSEYPQQEKKQENAAKRVTIENRANNNETWRYITFLKNGQWIFRKKPYEKDNLSFEVPIPRNPRNYVLMTAYESGNVNAVDLGKLLYGTGRNKNTLISCDTERNGGINLENGNVISAFCINKDGLVLMESEVNGETMVKAHETSSIGVHTYLNAQGNKMLPEGKLLRIAPIESEGVKESIKGMGILIKKNQKYSKNGVVKSRLVHQSLIDKILERKVS